MYEAYNKNKKFYKSKMKKKFLDDFLTKKTGQRI